MKKQKKKGFLALTVIVVYVIFLSVCCFSFLSREFISAAVTEIKRTTDFSEGSFKWSSPTLKVVLHEGETEKLARFTSLVSADFSGSGNVREIMDWADAHPDVDVRYTVVMPNGVIVSNADETVDISSVGHDDLSAYAEKLQFLPNARTVELGNVYSNAVPLTPEDILSLQSSYPDKLFKYSVELGGFEFDVNDTALDFTALRPSELDEAMRWLRCMDSLQAIAFGDENSSQLSMEDIASLAEIRPEAMLQYDFSLYGVPVSLSNEIIDLNHVPVDDEGESVVRALRCMKHCKKLDMDYCGVSDERMAEIREQFPDTEVVWRIWFGKNYSVRTDTERILASKPSVGGMLDDTVGDKLKYCTKVKYLDLGHNDGITDISFVKYMPDLEAFIIAINQCITDISPLASCRKLEYLELNTTYISDITALSSCTTLHHLNIGNTNINDISPLYNCTSLERLWIGSKTPVPAEQIAEMQERAPECLINTTTSDPHGEEWRWDYYDDSMFIYHYVPRYALLREQMGYTYSDYSFYWKDPLCGDPCPPQYAGTPDGIVERE